jgi:GntR family carbon starvation induced transcriptional regulator
MPKKIPGTPKPTTVGLQMAAAGSTAPQDIALQDAASFNIYRMLRADIVACRLKPGERLRFDALRVQYGAGVGTLREALSHLVSEGLVRTQAGRGFQVAPVSLADMLDVAEWRIEFEVRAVTQSIRNGDEVWEAEIVTAYHLLSRTEVPTANSSAESREQWISRHRRFHDAVGASCGSPWLLHFRSVLFDQARRYQSLVALHGPRLQPKDDDHREIMEAALARDVERAARAVERHIRHTVDTALKYVPGLDVLKEGPSSAKIAVKRRATAGLASASVRRVRD